MSRLYQAALSGEIDPAKAARLVFMLREVRCCLESESLMRLEARLDEVITPKGVIRRGTVEDHALSRAH
jgi:hypothetical protein